MALHYVALNGNLSRRVFVGIQGATVKSLALSQFVATMYLLFAVCAVGFLTLLGTRAIKTVSSEGGSLMRA